MKRILFYILLGVLGLLTFSNCSDSDEYPAPTPLDPSTLSYETRPGAVVLKWSIPENANYKYVKVTYTLPESGKQCMRLASVYSDHMVIDNLLKRYGEIVFTLQPCTPDGKGGETCTITAQAEAVEKTIKLEATNSKFSLEGKDPDAFPDEADTWSDNKESQEGKYEFLYDGITNDAGNQFHMSWSSPTPFPHYIVVRLSKEVDVSAFRFTYYGRNHGNKDNPKEIDVYVSNEFTPGNYDEAAAGATLVASLKNLPADQNAAYESPNITMNQPEGKFRYVWLKILSATSGSKFIALGELTFYRVKKSIYDPETGETTVLD